MTDNIFKETQQPSKQSNAQVIWDACVSLQNAERKISRRVLFELTGLRMTIIDDHVERFVGNNRLRRLGAGELEVVEVFPPAQPISKTVLGNGLVKLERGNDCWDLSPQESRIIGDLFRGDVAALYEIECANKALVRLAEQAVEIRTLKTQVAALMKPRDDTQLDLLRA